MMPLLIDFYVTLGAVLSVHSLVTAPPEAREDGAFLLMLALLPIIWLPLAVCMAVKGDFSRK